MRILAASRILVFIPSVFFLVSKGTAGELDTAFLAVQVLKLAAGATNTALLGLNMRDGLKIKEATASPPSTTTTVSAVSDDHRYLERSRLVDDG